MSTLDPERRRGLNVLRSVSSLSSARVALARLADVLAAPDDANRLRTTLPKPDGHLRVEGVGVRRPDGNLGS